MGIFKSIGRIGKKVLGGIGDAAKFAAPALNFIPGVGPIAAGVVGGLGGLAGELNDADGFNLGEGLTAGLGSGLAAYGLGRSMGAARGAGGAATAAAPGRGGLAGIGNSLAGSSGGGWANVAQDALGFARQNPGLVLGGLGAVTSALGSARNDGMESGALRSLEQDYARRRALRDQSIAAMLQPTEQRRDESALFADPGNPYARRG
jgi:hypothetical protein